MAATVTFNEPLERALQINVLGTREVLRLCRDMKHLVSTLYVSTAFSNCPFKQIEERIYDAPIANVELLQLDNDAVTAEQLAHNVQPATLQTWPNTYALSKAIAECVVRESVERNGLTAGVFRPGIGEHILLSVRNLCRLTCNYF